MTDHADLIRRLNEAADSEEVMAVAVSGFGDLARAKEHDNRAALLREAVKALEGGE